MRSILIAISVLVMTATASSAQLTHRLKGSLQTDAGAPIASATVRAEALAGFRGEPFQGGAAGDLSVTTDAKGGWNLLGIQAGLASAALMARDWETAGKLLWIARDLVPNEQRPAFASAINDRQQIARVQ